MPLFGAAAYDKANEREGDIAFDEQLRGLEEVIKAGKVCLLIAPASAWVCLRLWSAPAAVKCTAAGLFLHHGLMSNNWFSSRTTGTMTLHTGDQA